MRKPKALDQPLSSSPDLYIQPETTEPKPSHYKASMQLELQKFGQDSPKARQLLIQFDPSLEEDQDELDRQIETAGLDLTVTQDKALSALQILLDRTGYKGDGSREIESDVWKWEGRIPRLSFTWSEFYEAYGLQKHGEQYQGRQIDEAKKALEELKEDFSFVYQRKKYEGTGKRRKVLYDAIRIKRPLIQIIPIEGFSDLTEEELEQVKAGAEVKAKLRRTQIQVEFSPLVVDQLDTFYLLKPTSLHQDLGQLLKGKRPPRTYSLFIEWLLTLDRPVLKIGKEKLARRMRLTSMIEQRKKALLETTIQDCLKVAKELGYLLNYSQDATGMISLSLNEEKCKRIKPRLQEQK